MSNIHTPNVGGTIRTALGIEGLVPQMLALLMKWFPGGVVHLAHVPHMLHITAMGIRLFAKPFIMLSVLGSSQAPQCVHSFRCAAERFCLQEHADSLSLHTT